MNLYVPVVKKLIYNNEALIERSLPKDGYINVSVGDVVEPSDKLGTCKITYEIVELGPKFKPVKKKGVGSHFEAGMLVGSVGRSKFMAPFNGFLESENSGWIYRSEERDYLLLPGVWGEVIDISNNRSVLLKTQAVSVHMPISTDHFRSGELVVFPNPSDILTVQYFNNFIKSIGGKVVYVGNTITRELVNRAKEVNVGALLAGSASREVYDFAVQNGVALGLFTGFGNIDTPEYIYDFLNDITSRYVFFHGDKNSLQIPVPKENDLKPYTKPKSILKYLKKGMLVQILSSEHFGAIGLVDRVSKSSIFVKLHSNDEVVEVKYPNVVAVE